MESESQEPLDKQQPWWTSDPEHVFAAIGTSPLFTNFIVNQQLLTPFCQFDIPALALLVRGQATIEGLLMT